MRAAETLDCQSSQAGLRSTRPPECGRLRGVADAHTDFADGALEPDGAYDEVRFSGADLLGADAGGARFLDCLLDGADLTEAHLKDTRWTDCRLDRVRGVGTELVGATLQDCVLVEPRLGAVAAYGSSWRRVTVRGGKVDYLNLRGAGPTGGAVRGLRPARTGLRRGDHDRRDLRRMRPDRGAVEQGHAERGRPLPRPAGRAAGAHQPARRHHQPRPAHRAGRRLRRPARDPGRRLSGRSSEPLLGRRPPCGALLGAPDAPADVTLETVFFRADDPLPRRRKLLGWAPTVEVRVRDELGERYPDIRVLGHRLSPL